MEVTSTVINCVYKILYWKGTFIMLVCHLKVWRFVWYIIVIIYVGLWHVLWLLRLSREPVWSKANAWLMSQSKMIHSNLVNPSIDSCIRHYIRVV